MAGKKTVFLKKNFFGGINLLFFYIVILHMADARMRARGAQYQYPGNFMNAADVTNYVRVMDTNADYTTSFRFSVVNQFLNANGASGQVVFEATNVIGTGLYTLDDVDAIEVELRAFFLRMLNYVRYGYNLHNGSYVAITIIDTQSNRGDITSGFVRLNVFNINTFVDRIMYAFQSSEYLNLIGSIIVVSYSRTPLGNGYMEYDGFVESFIKKKRCIISIGDMSGYCFHQCVLLGNAQLNNPALYKSLVKMKRDKRERYLLEECKSLGERTYTWGVSLADISRFETIYNFGIMVFDLRSLQLLRSTSLDNFICILYVEGGPGSNGHYHYVNKEKIGSLWNRPNFCRECNKGYRDAKHRCISKCIACKSTDCEFISETNYKRATVFCPSCNKGFFSIGCYSNHSTSVCNEYHLCGICKLMIKGSKEIVYDENGKPSKAWVYPHKCEHVQCKTCGEFIPIDGKHECFLQPCELKQRDKLNMFYYDYESTIDEAGNHEVAGISCIGDEEDSEMMRFYTNAEFLDFIMKQKNATFVAHNSARYDIHFIIKELNARRVPRDDIICGTSVIYCSIKKGKVRFVDSYKLISIPLRKFPKTFGFDDLAKEYFPYRFFTPENKHYYGPLPDVSWFDFHLLSPSERADAMTWYEEHASKDISLYDMCMDYCDKDVLVLRRGCQEFRRWFMEISNDELNPFNYITIASVCMAFYRKYCMPENSIGILHTTCGYKNPRVREMWLAKQENVTGREIDRTIDGYDGWDGTTYYDFLTCYDNGCKKCFSPHSIHKEWHVPLHQLYYNWTQKLDRTSKYVYVWECECDLKELEDMAVAVQYIDPINLRDAFYGGRTEVFYPVYDAKEDEVICYDDYTSLYPSIQSCRVRGITPETYNTFTEFAYPKGHPIRITSDFGTVFDYFGVIKCKVTPPMDLHLPVLPEKKNGKLMFDNTPKVGTWSSIELCKAVELGYRIEEIYEVLHWPESTTELFSKYVGIFMKMKMDAKQEGNPGKYFISKLGNNSLWGKFAQNNEHLESRTVFTQTEFDAVLSNDELEIVNVIFIDKDTRILRFRKKAVFLSDPETTNLAVAIFTTAYARLRLYQAMEICGEDLIYCDTDSVIHKRKVDQVRFQRGKELGDLTDELDGDKITRFVSTGPKSYAYKTIEGKQVVKVKGIRIDETTKNILTFDSLRDMCLKKIEVKTQNLKFLIDPITHSIRTKRYREDEGKITRMTMNKRACIAMDATCMHTLPFNMEVNGVLQAIVL